MSRGQVLLAMIEPVHPQDVPRLPRKIEGFRRGQLHACGQFIAADAGFEPVVAGPLGGVGAIELAQHLDRGSVRRRE